MSRANIITSVKSNLETEITRLTNKINEILDDTNVDENTIDNNSFLKLIKELSDTQNKLDTLTTFEN